MSETTPTADRPAVPIEKLPAGVLKRLLYGNLRKADADGLTEWQRGECYARADRYHNELVRRGYACWESRGDEATD